MLLADLGHVLMTLLFTRLNGFAAWANFMPARRPPEPIPQEWLDRIDLTDWKSHPRLPEIWLARSLFRSTCLGFGSNHPSGAVPSPFALEAEASGSDHEIKCRVYGFVGLRSQAAKQRQGAPVGPRLEYPVDMGAYEVQ